jgi:TorA maturation chaperone TorD
MSSAPEPKPELELDPLAQALARTRLYSLLARLFVEGVQARTLTQLEQLGWLDPSSTDATLQLEDLAADHHATFALGVFPYAGVFLDASASAGGYADTVRDHYTRSGYTPRLDELSPDHLGVELGFLAFLTGAQADALEDGRPGIALALERPLAEFLDACVLAWLPALVAAVEDLPGTDAFWSVLVRDTLALLADHRSKLPSPVVPVALIEPGDLLADPRTGVRQIVERLLTPAISGVFLTRSDIVGLGRAHELPRGFGSRLLMLENLLRSAIDYSELGPLIAALDERLDQRDHSLAQIAAAHDLAAAVAPWRDALLHTRALLHRISTSPVSGSPS